MNLKNLKIKMTRKNIKIQFRKKVMNEFIFEIKVNKFNNFNEIFVFIKFLIH